MKKGKLILGYDEDAAVFYLSLGEPKPSVTGELDNHVLVRRDPKTHDVTGITITNLSGYIAKKREMKLETSAYLKTSLTFARSLFILSLVDGFK